MENNNNTSFAKVSEKLKELPVNGKVEAVVDSVKSGKVTVLTAETGSGKTLLASTRLADASDGQVVVLVPRRYLAINAAETITELSENKLGEQVGYAIGRKSGDRSKFSPDTKLVFATYGYALNSGLLDTAKTIVLDEVHESGVNTSLARAIIYDRLKHDKSLKVLEMSATLDAPKQAAYWNDVASTEIFHAEGKAFPCDFREDKKNSVEKVVCDLIQNENRKGVAVFLPGVKEIKTAAENIRKMMADSGVSNVEVATIYGDMSMEERTEAVKPPKEGNVKVLIGTNVIESGVNIPWLDSGVSNGKTKIPYYRENGAKALVLEDLPQWRIIQQEGRVKRFCEGVFVLASKMGMSERAKDSTPEITRVSLNSLVLEAANYGKNPLNLHYDADVDKNAIYRAKDDLIRLKLLNDDWSLTEKGRFVTSLPLEADAATMLWEAPPEIKNDITILAAISEIDGLRDDENTDKKAIGHGQDKNSDITDALKVFKKLEDMGDKVTEEKCKKLNVGWKKYQDAKELVDELNSRHSADNKDEGENKIEQRPATDEELVQALLQGSVNHLFDKGTGYLDLIRGNKDYTHDRKSVVGGAEHRFSIASLREIQTDGEPLTIAGDITKVSTDALMKFATREPDIFKNLQINNAEQKGKRDYLTANYCGKQPIQINIPKNQSPEMQAFLDENQLGFAAKHGKKQKIEIKPKDEVLNWAEEELKKPKEKRKWR